MGVTNYRRARLKEGLQICKTVTSSKVSNTSSLSINTMYLGRFIYMK